MANRMKPTYKLFVVDDDDFDKLYKDLPYMTKEKLKDSLGFANPKTNEAYVRRTGIAELDDSTIEHELQELLVKVSPDEQDGIRYKKGGAAKSFVPILLGALAAPFTGGTSLIPALLGAASSVGMNQYAQSKHPEQLGEPGQIGSILTQGITGALSGYSGGKLAAGGIAGGKQAEAGFLSKAGGIAKGALLGTPAAIDGQPISVINPAAAAATPGFQAATTGLLGSAGSLPGTNVNPFIAKPLTSVASGINAQPLTGAMNPEAAMSLKGGGIGDVYGNMLGQTPPMSPVAPLTTAITQVPQTVTQAPAASGTLMSKVFDFASKPGNLLGAGALGASMLPKTPEFVMPDSVEQLRSKIMEGQGVSPLGKQAQMELSSILKSTPQELYAPNKDAYYQATLRRTEEAYTRAQEQLDATYNLAGVYGSGEHLAAKDRLNQQLTNAKTDLYAVTEQRNFELARTEKYQAIQDSLGVDKNVMDDLLGLTGMDVQQAANVYNAKAADIQAIREALGTIGSELLLKGQGITKSGGMNINIGGGGLGG